MKTYTLFGLDVHAAHTSHTPSVIEYGLLTLILLITISVVFNLFYQSTKSLLLGMKCVSKHQDLQIFVRKSNKYE